MTQLNNKTPFILRFVENSLKPSACSYEYNYELELNMTKDTPSFPFIETDLLFRKTITITETKEHTDPDPQF
ncbi:MAG: hypothetical protein ACTSW1_06235 [Candidatus Hodarchaeales archaeon]